MTRSIDAPQPIAFCNRVIILKDAVVLRKMSRNSIPYYTRYYLAAHWHSGDVVD